MVSWLLCGAGYIANRGHVGACTGRVGNTGLFFIPEMSVHARSALEKQVNCLYICTLRSSDVHYSYPTLTLLTQSTKLYICVFRLASAPIDSV
jgi:hypothetical protein